VQLSVLVKNLHFVCESTPATSPPLIIHVM
jgi:hypothetical protein